MSSLQQRYMSGINGCFQYVLSLDASSPGSLAAFLLIGNQKVTIGPNEKEIGIWLEEFLHLSSNFCIQIRIRLDEPHKVLGRLMHHGRQTKGPKQFQSGLCQRLQMWLRLHKTRIDNVYQGRILHFLTQCRNPFSIILLLPRMLMTMATASYMSWMRMSYPKTHYSNISDKG
eukprot:scaffold28709_cov43-Attheya_sp.AAC.2